MALVEIKFRSFTLNRSVTFSALIPADRDAISDKGCRYERRKFKTLYLLHGHAGDHNDFLHLTDVNLLADSFNIAIIFPSGENSFYLEDDDLGTSHSAYVGDELVEFTRRIFPLSENREDTFIGGISMGAYGALINALRYNETFSRIISMSGAFLGMEIADKGRTVSNQVFSKTFQRRVFGNPAALRQSNKDPRFLIEKLIHNNQPIPRIFQTCGREDPLIGVNRTLHDFLVSVGVKHRYSEEPGSHNWDLWRLALRKGVEWLFED